MKFFLQIALVIAALFAVYFLLAAALGALVWVVIALVAFSLAAALGRAWWQARQNKRPSEARIHQKADKKAEAALKELERRIG